MASFVPGLIDLVRRRRILNGRGPQDMLDRFEPPPVEGMGEVGEEPEAEYRRFYDSNQTDMEQVAEEPSALSLLRKHMMEQPREEDYKPSTGRRLLAGLFGGMAGFGSGAGAGANVAQGIMSNPWRRANEQWEERGNTLYKLGGLEAQAQRGKTEADWKGARIEDMQVDNEHKTRELEHRKEEAERKFELAMKNATSLEESRAAQATRMAELSRIQTEQNQLRRGELGVKQGQLGVSRGRLDLDARRQAEGGGSNPWDRPVPGSQQENIRQMAKQNLAGDPNWGQYWDGEGFDIPPELAHTFQQILDTEERNLAKRTPRNY